MALIRLFPLGQCVKHLPKHLRPRWRYLGLQFETAETGDFTRDNLQQRLWYGAQNLVGDVGSATLDLQVIAFEYSQTSGQAIVKTRRGQVDQARAVIACLDSVADTTVGIRVRGVSGTVGACRERFLD